MRLYWMTLLCALALWSCDDGDSDNASEEGDAALTGRDPNRECACGDPNARIIKGAEGCAWPDAEACTGWTSAVHGAENHDNDISGVSYASGTEMCSRYGDDVCCLKIICD